MSAKPYILYDEITGRILQTGVAPNPGSQGRDMAGVANLVAKGDPRTEYVDLGSKTVVPRPAATAVVDKTTVAGDDLDIVELSGVDEGDLVTAKYEGTQVARFAYTPQDKQLTFAVPGEYTIHVSPPVKQEAEVTISAT